MGQPGRSWQAIPGAADSIVSRCFGVQRLMRFNILGCFLVAASTALVSSAAELLGQPDSFYRANGYAVLLALVLLFAWPLAAWRLRTAASPTPT